MKRESLSITKKYELTEKLGEGASSEVYKAICSDECSGLKQAVVLKILKSKKSLSLLRKEFSSLTSVRSSRCVRALGWEMISDRPTLVLEYVESVSLFELMRSIQLSESQANEIYFQIYQGLQDLSSQGLFHGDLNPKNILINTKGEALLIDYGFANTEYTTFAYATTARIKGISEPNFDNDLFSLNCIYQEITGSKHNENNKGSSDFKICNSIGLLVKHLLIDKNEFKTQIIPQRKNKRIPLKFLFYLILGFSVTALSSVHGPKNLSHVNIELRSQGWTEVYLNNQSLGYTPLKLRVQRGKSLDIKVKTPEGLKSWSLTPKEDRTILLK